MSPSSSEGSKPFLHIGKRVGRWTLEQPVESQSHRKWSCVCECGTRRVVRQDHLVSGRSRSCGCATVEAHGRAINAAMQRHPRPRPAPSFNGGLP